MINFSFFFLSLIAFADEVEKPPGIVQLTDDFYPAFSIQSQFSFNGNFRMGSIQATATENFKMSDEGVNASISIPVVLNEQRPGSSFSQITPRVGGGPLPTLQMGFEVYRNQDRYGEVGGIIQFPYDSSNQLRFGLMMLGFYQHRFIWERWTLEGNFTAGTSFSNQLTSRNGVFSTSSQGSVEQQPVFTSRLNVMPGYVVSDSLSVLLNVNWSYRSPSTATQNGSIVFSQSAENDLGVGAGVAYQIWTSSYFISYIFRALAPPQVEDSNNVGAGVNWIVYF